MSASKWILCVCLLTFFPNSATPEVINVLPGDDALLQCQGTRDAAILHLKWIRPDLEPEGSVFFFSDDPTYENYQHPSFRGRVELRDPQMKYGDASVILKNVDINDSGTYKCYVRIKGNTQQLIHSVHLKVEDSGDWMGAVSCGGARHTGDGGDKSDRVEVAVAVMYVAVIALVILRTVIKNSCRPPAEQTVVLQQV